MSSMPSLHELRHGQDTSRHKALFDPGMPAALRCFAVLDGRADGVIFTDDPVTPAWGAVREAGSGTLYLGGVLDAPTLGRVIGELRRTGDVLVGMWPNDEYIALLPPNPDYDGTTLEFVDHAVDDERWRDLARVPPGCELRQMDRALFERCADRNYYTAIYGDVERALSEGIGVCLHQHEEILCEAFAGPAGLGTIEIATITHEAYRRRGYATATCARLIAECEAMGLQTYWNCASQNQASVGLARKLGYQTPKEYRLLAWFREQP